MRDDLNESFFFRNNGQNYSIIHLAMHGILDQGAPILSGLVFTEN
jgi:CHAT domain-containing protein